jgi:hypothetical protein
LEAKRSEALPRILLDDGVASRLEIVHEIRQCSNWSVRRRPRERAR